MKSSKIFLLSGIVIAICATLFISSCNKKFDEPPYPTTTLAELGVKANKSIDELKAYATVGNGQFFQIAENFVIIGTVVANDKSGNFYKQIYIQDASGGICINIEGTGLYNTFPVGREVAVFCKDLYMTNRSGMLELCTKTIQNSSPAILGISPAFFEKYLKEGAINQPVVPIVVTTAQLGKKLQGSLVKLLNQQVVKPDVYFSTYADSSANKNTLNVNIEDCSGLKNLIRTSGYASFAALSVPVGNGSVTAIYTVYNTTNQLIIRDTSDVQMNGLRCDGTLGNLVRMSIKDARDYSISGDSLPANTYIEGVIVSSTPNEASNLNYRIQDESGYGIQIRFTSSGNKYNVLGERVRIFVEKLLVAPYQGDLQINYVPGALTVGSGTIVPRITTANQINPNFSTWASTVVQLNNVTIAQTGSASSGVTYTITDASGSIDTYVRNASGIVMPASATSITAYVSLFSGNAQITLRQQSDIK